MAICLLLLTAACSKSEERMPSAGACDSAAPVVDTTLLAFLSRSRALHHEADVAESDNDTTRAIAALERVGTKVPTAAPEIDEVIADTRARLAELRAAKGEFDRAAKDVDEGLTHAKDPTYFRGHLFEVRGLVEEKRALALTKAGNLAEAAGAKKRAIDASEEAVKIQEEVINRALEKKR